MTFALYLVSMIDFSTQYNGLHNIIVFSRSLAVVTVVGLAITSPMAAHGLGHEC